MSLSHVGERMRADWERRIGQDYRFWMSDGYSSDQAMWDAGLRDYKILLQDFNFKAGQVLLDVGCGVGRLLKPALKDFSRVIGLDISPQALKLATALLENPFNLELKLGSGLGLDGIAPHSVDVITSFATLGCITTDVVARYLVEMHRVLRPEGELRLQMYLGKPQDVASSDTLFLRCYEPDAARQAFAQAGFELRWIRELPAPLQASVNELGIQAVVVALKKTANTPAQSDQISKTLLPNGELLSNGITLGAELECLMTVNYARELIGSGNLERAKQLLANASESSAQAAKTAAELLSQISSSSEDKSSEKETENVSVIVSSQSDEVNRILAQKFPEAAAALAEVEPKNDWIEIRNSNDGAVLFVRGQCLDHPTKPVAAAEKWATQIFRKIDAKTASVTVVGVGTGYHIEALLKLREQAGFPFQLHLIEPSPAILNASLKARDARPWLERVASLQTGQKAKVPSPCDLFEVRPATLSYEEGELQRLRRDHFGQRGLSLLAPSIGVVGPFHGGTLPIMQYVTLTLQLLNQRVRPIDVSCFDTGYTNLENFVKDKVRRGPVENMYYEMVSQIILESVTEKPVDILFCMALAPISPRVLTELRNRGIITVLWFVEDYQRFTYWQQVAPYFDFIFTIQKGKCVQALKAAGANEVLYCPVACEPNVHAPLMLSAEEKARWGSPISFMGAGYHNRQQLFASLAEFPLKIWGTEWPDNKPFDRMVQDGGKRLSPAEYIKVFNATDINLNLHSSNERDGVDPFGDFINPRTFELASAGAFQLVDERELLGEAFEVGKELITFSNATELKEKIRYFLDRPEERKEVAQRARARALRDHTYAHRIREMLATVYSQRFEQLKARQEASPWEKLKKRAASHPELLQRCNKAFDRGEQPNLDGLISDIVTGQGKLSDTEKKLLFLFHLRKQIVRHAKQDKGEG